MCDGRCVRTIVFSRPIRAASQPAARSESAEKTFIQKKTTASCSVGSPHFRKNQYAMIDSTAKPPANESRPKRNESFTTVLVERWMPRNLRSPWILAVSTLSESVRKISRLTRPTAA